MNNIYVLKILRELDFVDLITLFWSWHGSVEILRDSLIGLNPETEGTCSYRPDMPK